MPRRSASWVATWSGTFFFFVNECRDEVQAGLQRGLAPSSWGSRASFPALPTRPAGSSSRAGACFAPASDPSPLSTSWSSFRANASATAASATSRVANRTPCTRSSIRCSSCPFVFMPALVPAHPRRLQPLPVNGYITDPHTFCRVSVSTCNDWNGPSGRRGLGAPTKASGGSRQRSALGARSSGIQRWMLPRVTRFEVQGSRGIPSPRSASCEAVVVVPPSSRRGVDGPALRTGSHG